MHRGIRWKLTISYLFLTFFSLLLLGGISLWFYEKTYMEDLRSHLETEAKIARKLVQPYFREQKSAAALDTEVKSLKSEIPDRVTVIERNGKVIADTDEPVKLMENHLNRPEIQEVLIQGKGASTRFSKTLKTRMMYIAWPVKENGQIVGFVRVAVSLQFISKALGHLQRILILSFLGVSLLAIILSLNFAKGITRPIEEITRVARKITQGDYNQTIYRETVDEIGQLGTTINIMTKTIKDKLGEIARGKSELEAVLNNMASGVIVFDREGYIQLVNPATVKAFDLKKDINGQHALEGLRNFQFDESIQEVYREGSAIKKELKFIYPQEKIYQIHLAPIKTENEEIIGAVAVFHDITSIRKLELMRTEFVANASHELQTPLTAVKGFAETLLDGAMYNPETCAKFIGIINNEAERLSRLVDDLLDLANLEAKKINLNLKPMELKRFLPDAVQRLVPHAEKNDLKVKLEIPDTLPKVKGDPDWLAQVIYNLLENSIKYTLPGGIITVKAESEKEQVKVSIADTGMGIPAQDLPRVFERFYRVDKARSRRMGGTGLGLAIVKHVIEAHGGKVAVESIEGVGSTFSFTLETV